VFEIRLYDVTDQSLLSPFNHGRMMGKMSDANMIADVAERLLLSGNKAYVEGDVDAAMQRCKDSRKQTLAYVNRAFDAIEFQCSKRGKP
jgi:hypothetical protein